MKDEYDDEFTRLMHNGTQKRRSVKDLQDEELAILAMWDKRGIIPLQNFFNCALSTYIERHS